MPGQVGKKMSHQKKAVLGCRLQLRFISKSQEKEPQASRQAQAKKEFWHSKSMWPSAYYRYLSSEMSHTPSSSLVSPGSP